MSAGLKWHGVLELRCYLGECGKNWQSECGPEVAWCTWATALKKDSCNQCCA